MSLLHIKLKNFKQKYIDVEDLNLRWDLIKMEIRGFTVKYSKNKYRKSTETILQDSSNDLFTKNRRDQMDKCLQSFVYFFWKELHLDMIKSFNFAFHTGILSISQRIGIITLVRKPNKDATSLENLRPISLLNVDYKILTKTIAKRLGKVLPKIINPDQTSFVKGPYISENESPFLLIFE